jgi:hypothetical protein
MKSMKIMAIIIMDHRSVKAAMKIMAAGNGVMPYRQSNGKIKYGASIMKWRRNNGMAKRNEIIREA